MRGGYLNVLVSIAVLGAYGLAITYLGFFVSTFAYLVGHMAFLGIRKVHVLLGIAVGTLTVFYVVMEVLLGAGLPRGVLV